MRAQNSASKVCKLFDEAKVVQMRRGFSGCEWFVRACPFGYSGMRARLVQQRGELWLVNELRVSAAFCDGEKRRGTRSGGRTDWLKIC